MLSPYTCLTKSGFWITCRGDTEGISSPRSRRILRVSNSRIGAFPAWPLKITIRRRPCRNRQSIVSSTTAASVSGRSGDPPPAPRIAASDEGASPQRDRLVAAHVRCADRLISTLLQGRNRGVRKPGFEVEATVLLTVEPRSAYRLLRVHRVDEHVEDCLEHCADQTAPSRGADSEDGAAGAKRDGRAPASHPLPRHDGIAKTGARVEMPEKIVVQKPETRRHHPCPRHRTDRVRNRHDGSARVGRSHVRRMPLAAAVEAALAMGQLNGHPMRPGL